MSQRNTVKERVCTVESDKLRVARVSSTNLGREKDLVRHGKPCPSALGSHTPGDIVQRRKQPGLHLALEPRSPSILSTDIPVLHLGNPWCSWTKVHSTETSGQKSQQKGTPRLPDSICESIGQCCVSWPPFLSIRIGSCVKPSVQASSEPAMKLGQCSALLLRGTTDRHRTGPGRSGSDQ